MNNLFAIVMYTILGVVVYRTTFVPVLKSRMNVVAKVLVLWAMFVSYGLLLVVVSMALS